jgi:hypothetical protein
MPQNRLGRFRYLVNDFLFRPSKPIYLIGEERFAVHYPNAGVYVHKNQIATLSAMIQNRSAKPIQVYITMDYEYIPGKPQGYVDIIPVPQDALGASGIPLGQQRFTMTSSPYTSPHDGKILMMYGHLHDVSLILQTAFDSTANEVIGRYPH